VQHHGAIGHGRDPNQKGMCKHVSHAGTWDFCRLRLGLVEELSLAAAILGARHDFSTFGPEKNLIFSTFGQVLGVT
jgi:hypothetical protein